MNAADLPAGSIAIVPESAARETRSTCPYCGVGCGCALPRAPRGGACWRPPFVPPPSGGFRRSPGC
ncbi:hypothetical protein GALL_278390 [mine drainage metagenome]|uniref:4Fe-4S Mo/W bis-MGD-type domain-containing protein n=1 Tax=mine drainage metagenome TaxID=410659 RepID=A0A1J5R495_9ZZZZ